MFDQNIYRLQSLASSGKVTAGQMAFWPLMKTGYERKCTLINVRLRNQVLGDGFEVEGGLWVYELDFRLSIFEKYRVMCSCENGGVGSCTLHAWRGVRLAVVCTHNASLHREMVNPTIKGPLCPVWITCRHERPLSCSRGQCGSLASVIYVLRSRYCEMHWPSFIQHGAPF